MSAASTTCRPKVARRGPPNCSSSSASRTPPPAWPRATAAACAAALDLAASLVAPPPVLFLDEPTTGLDPASRNEIWELIRELVGGGTTVLLTTQYLEEADTLADNIVVVDHGQIVATGSPNHLKAQPGGERGVATARSRRVPGSSPAHEQVAAGTPRSTRRGSS